MPHIPTDEGHLLLGKLQPIEVIDRASSAGRSGDRGMHVMQGSTAAVGAGRWGHREVVRSGVRCVVVVPPATCVVVFHCAAGMAAAIC